MSKRVELLYDVVSTPSYLAWTQMPKLAAETGAEVELVPVFCGGIFKATGNEGPFSVPAKLEWINGDMLEWNRIHGADLVLNPHAPVNSLPLMRGVFVARERGEEEHYIKTMFEAVWTTGRNLSDPDIVKEYLESADLDADTYFQEVQRPEIKQMLIANTEAAVERGAFGVPTFFVGDKMIFGQDRLDFVRRALTD